MTAYAEKSRDELLKIKAKLDKQFAGYEALGLKLDMSRGKPAGNQLDLSMRMLDVLGSPAVYTSAKGTDCRNYGELDGLPEAKELLSSMLDDDPANVIVFGNASLSIMYDTIARCMTFGVLGSTPWNKLPKVKWICPVPGYDRHFSILETFGIEMIAVPMNDDGPDMTTVEALVAGDESIKGIWCVPKYSNPEGTTYSDKVVRRLASMKCAAEDFRIFWDNAYCVHHLYADAKKQDSLLDIGKACKKAGTPNRYFKIASTSKVTFAGAGIAGLAASTENVAEVKKYMAMQTIGHDKLNQLRHVKFLKNEAGIAAHMKKHAKIIAPKFEAVLKKLESGLAGTGVGKWKSPRGGYFISFNAMDGTATRVVELARQAGVVMTNAGATYPKGEDPFDSNIRIAPTLPPIKELRSAMDVFICCVKLAAVEQLLK